MANQKSKKIFYLITKSNWGGAQRYVFDLALHINKTENFDVTVYSGEGKLLKDKLTKAGIKNYTISNLKRDVNLFSDIRVFLNLISLFRREKPEIIHLNSSKIGIMGGLAGRLAGVPKIIFTGHGWAFNEKRSFLTKPIIFFLHWLTVVLSHKTIAVSGQTKKDILRLPFIKNKIFVVHHGCDVFDLEDRENARQFLTKALNNRVAPADNKIWLGTIAELHTNKGLDIAAQAMAELKKKFPDFIYLIIGGGEKKAELEELITKLNLEDSVFLAGEIPEARKYLKALDIFILPSRTESLGLALLEAGIAKLPAIASDTGGIPEIITSKENGLLFSVSDFAGLADNLELLIKNKELQDQYGENLYSTVTQKFSLGRMFKETEKLYNY